MKTLRPIICVALAGASTMFLSSCETPGQGATTGALVGGGTGALVGGIIGHQSGHTTEGALIGGAVGAVGGGVVGHQQGQINQMNRENAYYRNQGRY